MAEKTFEKALKDLEDIVLQLESSEADLNKSMKLYEKGIENVRFCNEKLEAAKLKITQLKEENVGE